MQRLCATPREVSIKSVEVYIGVYKRPYDLDIFTTRLKHTSEVAIHVAVLTRNLFKRIRTLLWLLFSEFKERWGDGFWSSTRCLKDFICDLAVVQQTPNSPGKAFASPGRGGCIDRPDGFNESGRFLSHLYRWVYIEVLCADRIQIFRQSISRFPCHRLHTIGLLL